MDAVLDTLPDDADALKAMVLSMRAETARMLEETGARQAELAARDAEIAALQAEHDRLVALNERLEHIVAQLQRLKFGPRSEKLDPDQLQLGLEDLEQACAAVEAEEEKHDSQLKAHRTRQRRAERPSLPAHLPRVEVTIEPQTTACPCCTGAMVRIGEDIGERLDVVPAQYRVIVTRRPKYACRACEEIVQAPAPARLIEGGLPTERLVAEVMTAKYADHLPLYRQSQRFKRQGIEIDRGTLAFWSGYAAAELKPLWALMRDELLATDHLFADETTAPVLDPGRGRTKTGWFWSIARDERGWGGTGPPAVVYTYAPGRGAEHATALLKDFEGVLQTDGYGVYKALAAKGEAIVLAHCWAHARRKFFEIAAKGPAPIASEALVKIARLYEIEAEVRGQDPARRLAARQARSAQILEELKAWLEARLGELSGGSPTAKAIRYALGHWQGLTRFLGDGRIELDTNPIERAMRPIALNRKNALFAGSDEGAEHWAVIATLVECCKLHDVNVADYLADILTSLVNLWPNSRLAELTPWAWKAANPRA